MAIHEIPLEQRTVHGHFSRELEPILTIDSGDAISFATLDAGWGRGPPPPEVGERWQLQPRDFDRDSEGRPLGHALVGPVAVRGAWPGAVLEVRIDEVRASGWGWTWAGGWWSVLGERLRLPDLDGHLLEWELDGAAGVARDGKGARLRCDRFSASSACPRTSRGSTRQCRRGQRAGTSTARS
ncbi:MAG TPA: hypothetical protein VGJ58_10355 [Gaiellaceae bacterium]